MNLQLAKLEFLFRRIFFRDKNARKKYENRILHIYGPELLAKFHETALKHNKQYWICFGTLLGCYREHDIIGHDNDFDVEMFEEDLTIDFLEDLISKGFRVKHTIVTHKMDGYELTLSYKGADIDIFPCKKDVEKGTMTACIGMLYKGSLDLTVKLDKYAVGRVSLPYKGFELIKFLGVDVWAPKNTEEILKILYGENYMTPDKKYKIHNQRKNTDYIYKEPEDENWSYYYTYGWFLEQKEKGLI